MNAFFLSSGIRLDTLARFALWNQGLDYQHGTGHGVGHFLNVHEGRIEIIFSKSLLKFVPNFIVACRLKHFAEN